ncbi:MAD2L1 [Cordylochernes scorpioides]|uniref:MAD2L1 n=1 Tax=Cordylochernes scorpioides TaxID=51811 RepID=A0ABY6LLD2_9ARAC|nr:MAD2L1 [Cordylochernes scorpioides]
MATDVSLKPISIRGSIELVVEYLIYVVQAMIIMVGRSIMTDIPNFVAGLGVNSILYQRGVYPEEFFIRENKYDLTVYMSVNPGVIEFLDRILDKLKEYLAMDCVDKLVMVLANIKTKEILERWEFTITCDKSHPKDENGTPGSGHDIHAVRLCTYKCARAPKPIAKPLKTIQNEIRDVLRQIAASISFLPLIEDQCSFDLLLLIKKDVTLPDSWLDTHLHLIKDCEHLQFRSFSTSVHKVGTAVQYRVKQLGE